MKAQKKVRRIEDKDAVILENTYIVMNRMLLESNMNVKDAPGKISERNVIRNWKKGDPCFKVVEKVG